MLLGDILISLVMKSAGCNISGIVGGSEMLFDNTRMSLGASFPL